MKTVNDIRTSFLDYFADQDHEVVQSAPLIPHNDPTLMFVNSGMVPFKNLFTGKETRPYQRATTAQKCVRAGGKHNDLENVGYTARHHTFFEMLGNFSFGDYFKEQAIAHAWHVVTKTFGLPAEKLLVTIYHEDDEAAALWKKIAGLSDDRIIRISTMDNFWMMGDTGPCGPCSEIFYDHGEDIPGGPPGSPDEDGDRFIEIWNLVFMQYEQHEDGSRTNLPKPSIDTGMGLERVSAILQGKHDNYDIDLLRKIIEHSADLTGVSPDGSQAASHRVIADHLRASAFLIADGVMPSNEGRGYVLRRIMRRGMRHAHLLGAQDPMMYKLLPTLSGLMSEAYPELRRADKLITETLKTEETRFKKTLDRGLKLLAEETDKLSSGQALSGDVAFKLYDTYGFPIDLTQDALRAQSIDVDLEGFETAMEKQRAEARKNWSGSGEAATEKVWFDILDQNGPTEFLGYGATEAEAQIVSIIKDGQCVDKAKDGDDVTILTNQTPFYAESGGQVGDSGVLTTEDGCKAVITDTKKPLGKLWAHKATIETGHVATGDTVKLNVDENRRSAICANHSATHLLHKALQDVLGDHVAQKGSLQDDRRTRFDISHPHAITAEEMQKIETIVNNEIRANTAVSTNIMAIDDAMETGAMALFGEKYDDEVRVVSMGTHDGNKAFSVELCGGTHVDRTGDIGLFHIVAESAVSSGVRRVEAITGQNAITYYEDQDRLLGDIADTLKTSKGDLKNRIESLVSERKKMEAEISDLRKKLATGGASSGNDVKEINGLKFAARVLENVPAKDLKPMADDLKAQIGSGVITLIATNDGKASIVVAVTDDLTAQINAVDLVRTGSEALGGSGGGGRPDMAQAGGPNADAANDAVSAIEKKLGA
ncbi:MAG: alanine--tRNA ligase [Alphaproteobacteria bacterium]|jgi:alanyl-tRNA synthetase|nr:alanine--tRNA ligase [Alphaproteobacteria bacterium]MDP7223405.1 alanine--tRNA ligase [Alphaproteobacteria bacterium]